MALLLIGLKAWAALHTSSMAMLGSLADSGLDLLASLVVLAGVRIAAVPADRDHRFGHGKAEALAALIQVIIITLSALFIGYRSVGRLINGAQTTDAELGIGVSLIAIAFTFALITYQRYVVRRTGSVAISTDRLHYASDLLLNTSVIAALVLDQYAGMPGADAIFGLLIAAWLLWGAWRASSHSLDQLMDREWPEDQREKFLAAGTGISGACRSPRFSHAHERHASFRAIPCLGSGDWTIAEAHERMDRVEEKLQHRFPGTEILMHLDPEGHTDRETMLPPEITEKAS